MGKQPRNYSDLIKFAIAHPEYSRTKAIEKFREAGGEAQKQAGLKALREAFDLEKGQEKTYTIKEILQGYKDEKPKKKTPKKKTPKRSTFGVEHNVHYERQHSKHLLQRIEKLYGQTMDKMFAVGVVLDNDDYTQMTKKNFQFFIPFNTIGKDNKIPPKKFFKEFAKQAIAYYKNLVSLYNGEYEEVMGDFKKALSEINRYVGLTLNSAKGIFEEHGINIESIDLISYN